MALPTDFSNLRIAREGPLPGYTGHIPGVKANVMGHSYSDGCKRGVAITNALRNNEFPKAIHLVIMSNKMLLQVDAIIAIITCTSLLVLVVSSHFLHTQQVQLRFQDHKHTGAHF